jgi:hypothetical protein
MPGSWVNPEFLGHCGLCQAEKPPRHDQLFGNAIWRRERIVYKETDYAGEVADRGKVSLRVT